MTPTASPRVLIAAYAGFGNCGDELIVASMIEHLRELRPAASFNVLSGEPAATRAMHGVNSIAWRDINRLIGEIRSSDLVLLGGGGLLQDYWGVDPDLLFESGAWGLPMFAAPALLAALERKPLMLYALGIGPLTSQVGRRLVRAIAEGAADITVRDPYSAGVLAELGIASTVTADPAFAPPAGLAGGRSGGSTAPCLGVAIRGWSIGVDESYWRRELAQALDRFVEREDAPVRLLTFQQARPGEPGDRAAAEAVAALMRNRARVSILDCAALAGLGAEVSACRWFCAMRLHSLILAAQAGVPAVALSYDPKVSAVAAALGAEARLLRLDEFDAVALDNVLRALVAGDAGLDGSIATRCDQLAGLARENARRAVALLERPAAGSLGAEAQLFLSRSVARAARRQQMDAEQLGRLGAELAAARPDSAPPAGRTGEELDGLRDALASAQAELNGLRSALDVSQHELAAARQILEAAQGEVTGLRTALDVSQHGLAAERLILEASRSELSGLRAALEESRGELNGLRSALDASQHELAAERLILEATQGEVSGLRAALEQSRGELDGMRAAIEASEDEIDGLRLAISESDRDSASLYPSLKKSRDEITALWQKQAEARGEIAGLRLSLESARDELSGLRPSLAEARGETAGLRRTLAEAQGVSSGLTSRIEQSELEMAAMRQGLAQSQAETARLQADLAQARNETGLLRTRLEHATSRARQTTQELHGAVEECATARGALGELRGALRLARRRVLDLEAALRPHEDPRLAAILKRAAKTGLDLVAWAVPGFIRRAARPAYLRYFYYPLFPERRPLPAAAAPPTETVPVRILVHSAYPPFVDFKSSLYRTLPLDFSLVTVACDRGLVSVVLPVFNGERYLNQAIDSVLGQSYERLELIVVDDGSTDATAAILSGYANEPRLRVIRQRNQKLPAALNAGFRQAHGEFLTWTSHDNAWYPHCLTDLVAALRARPDIEMVYADEEVIDERGQPALDSEFCPGYQDPPGSNHICWPRDPGELNFVRNNYIGSQFLYRAWAARIVGEYDTACFGYEDYDYWMRMNSLFRVAHAGSRRAMGRYRLHPDSLSAHDRELSITERTSAHMRVVAARMERLVEPQDITLVGVHPWFEALATAYREAGHNVHLSPTEERFRLTRSAPRGLIVCASAPAAFELGRSLGSLQPSVLVELGQPGAELDGGLDWAVRTACCASTDIGRRREIEADNPAALLFPLLAIALASQA
jgi:polysaccharide pyruvyl transferase CsaB